MKERSNPRRVAASFLALGFLAAAALGATAFSETYGEIKGSGSAGEPVFVSRFQNLDGSDSHTVSPTAAMTGRSFLTKGEPFVELTPRLTAAGATACVCVNRRSLNGRMQGIADIQTATALAGAERVYDGTGYYARPLIIPTYGWPAVEILVFDVSGSNTVDLLPVRVGQNGMAAGTSESQ